MIAETRYDVVIAGAGPVGMTTALTLKAMQRHLKICVIDKGIASERDHGFSVQSDSLAKIIALMDEAIANNGANLNLKTAQDIKTFFTGWEGNVPLINEIEGTLIKTASDLGITILRGKDYGIDAGTFDELVDPNLDSYSPLKGIIQNAKIIVGTGDSNNSLRKKMVQPEPVDSSEAICVKNYKGKVILLVGDADSEVKDAEGFKKGLSESTYCAKAINDFFVSIQPKNKGKREKRRFSRKPEYIPQQFVIYQQKVRGIFKDEVKNPVEESATPAEEQKNEDTTTLPASTGLVSSIFAPIYRIFWGGK